jgi:hypothetical protein
MNRRFASVVAACAVSFLTTVPMLAQSKPDAAQAKPTAAAPAPAAPAKWIPPIKGTGTVEFIDSRRRVKGAVETKFKLKNTSKGALALLNVEEIWYNAKGEIAMTGNYRHRQLLNPGEIIEFTITSADKGDLISNNLLFKHANGKIDPKRVKSF